MRVVWMIVVATCLVGGCGRRDFDKIVDASPTDMSLVDVQLDASPLAGCALYLAMDEASWNGTTNEVKDSCNNLHPGTATNATTTVDPVRGRVGAFGASSCIVIPDALDLRASSAVTMSAWVRSTTVDPTLNGQGVIGKRTDKVTNNEYSLFIYRDDSTMTKNHAWVDIDTDANRVEDPNFDFPIGQWHQVTAVFDGSLPQAQRLNIYVDGTLSMTVMVASTTIAPYATEPDVAVGCLWNDAPAQGFVGDLDDVALWTRPLDATEVAAWYTATTR